MTLPSGILVEAEAFTNYGGWTLDSQFELEMGSPYLLAHGVGVPVSDATTTVAVPSSGDYVVWVRAKDWFPGHHPGRFQISLNNSRLSTIFGANDKDWKWENAGRVRLPKGGTGLALHDLTGFNGRCDAIFLTEDSGTPPEGGDKVARTWRKKQLGLPDMPANGGHFDVVVLGGGVVGSAAALASARLGERVALIHNRPLLGGNASVEIGIGPRGVKGPFIDELIQRSKSNGDLNARNLLEKEQNATLFMEYTIYNATTTGSNVVSSVDARDSVTGRELRFTAPVFIDCTGRAVFGQFADAETLYGQESIRQYGERMAQPEANELHHGHSLYFRTGDADTPVSFPEVPWALEVAKDFASLQGQSEKPGVDNGDGPSLMPPDVTTSLGWEVPASHFWEYGQYLDPYTNGEHIRDHLYCAVVGAFYNVKSSDPQKYANLTFEFLAFVAAQGEFRRYKGDHVLSETDIRQHKVFSDAVAKNEGAFCMHHPPNPDAKYDFRIKHWMYDERDDLPYDIPFRCLYSINIDNVLMAGKHISVTHVAGSNTKFMANGGQHAIATAAAAHLCNKHRTTPKRIGQDYLKELQVIAKAISEHNLYPRSSVSKPKSLL